MFENLKQQWEDMDSKFRWVILGISALGVVVVGTRFYQERQKPSAPIEATKAVASAQPTATPNDGAAPATDPSYHLSVVPTTSRNQGLEVLQQQIEQMREEFAKMRNEANNGQSQNQIKLPSNSTSFNATSASNAATNPTDVVNLDAALPGKVTFDSPGSKTVSMNNGGVNAVGTQAMTPSDVKPTRHMKVLESEETPVKKIDAAEELGPTIPVNAGIEGVLLSGFNARPTGSIGGAAGSVNSANNVGAPFVSRLKGDAILPNHWKLSDIGDCFLGGSGIAVLSAGRAYVISDKLSCIASNGEVWEANISAYGLDVDGTLGLSGTVVTKQGSLLMQTALAGMASGLGSALSPTAVPSYNSNATNGSSPTYQYPSPSVVMGTAVGSGVNQASAQLAKFYLEFAKEIFPVVEVVAGTRVTWILKESVTLKKRISQKASK